MKIAVYGKGGIGKSTISANLSAALAHNGLKILQIGCDPKHDSTRLLLGENVPVTVLDYVKKTLPGNRRLEDIVFRGYQGIACVEAGGPEPGVGCAGRGIITMFELLSELGLDSHQFDITLYDVLGDVVCGGFAVPVREEYADAVIIVTSGEYMSLYAANNILLGIQNFTNEKGRVAGIIFNERGLDDELERVTRFAQAVSLPILAHIPRSSRFATAEKEGKPILELFPDSPEAAIIRMLADHIRKIQPGAASLLHIGSPLSDQDRDILVMERKPSGSIESYGPSVSQTTTRSALSPSVKNKRPLIGCAFAGAVVIANQISGAATVMHAPVSCSLLIGEKIIGTGLRTSQLCKTPYLISASESLFSTNLADNDFIHGGEIRLADTIEGAISRGYTWIFVVTSCVPGLNGDRTRYVAGQLHKKHPGTRIIPILVDGNITGDFSQGMIQAYREILQQVVPGELSFTERSVTLVAERIFAPNEERHIKVIEKLLNQLVVTINCRIFSQCPITSISQAGRSSLFLPTDSNDFTDSIRPLIESAYHRPFLKYPLPIGRQETEIWLQEVASFFRREESAKTMIQDARKEYEQNISRIRDRMAGKTLLITTQKRSIDWILDLAMDMGMIVLKVGILYSPFNDTFHSRYEDQISFSHGYDVQKRSEDIRSLHPDLVLYTYPHLSPGDDARSALIPYTPGFGFFAGIQWAERWSRIIRLPVTEGWKYDGEGML